MKKKLLFLSCLILNSVSFSQTYFEDDFQGAELTTNNAWNKQDVIEAEVSDRTWYYDNTRARISNYKDGGNHEMESWMITSAVDLSGLAEPAFSFDHTKRFEGDDLVILVSTDYDGTSNPTGFTWNDITSLADMDANHGAWTMVSSGIVSLSAYLNETVHVAFKYNGSDTDGSTYQVDDVFFYEGDGLTEVPTECASEFVFCEDFESGSLTANNAWTVHNIVVNTSVIQSWRRNEVSGNGFAQCSNFTDGANYEIESWLITPEIDLTGATQPLLSFDNVKRFAGDDLQVHISVNYDGTSDPSTATWDNISAFFTLDANEGAWDFVQSGDVDLSAYNDQTIHVAFRYYGGETDGSTLRLDNIKLVELDTDPEPTPASECDNGIFCDDFEGASLTGNNAWEAVAVVESTSGLNWFHYEFNENGMARVSNFNDGANEEMEAWLVSPHIDLTSNTTAKMIFDHTKRFSGDNLELLISINYDGQGAPGDAAFEWTNISDRVNWDENTGSWNMVSSGVFDLSDFGGEKIHLAFKYVGGNTNGSTNQIDNILIDEAIEEEPIGECEIGYFCDDFEGGSLSANNEWYRVHVVESPSSLNWFHNIFNDNGTARVSNFKDGANEIMEAWLISPSIDLSAAQDPVFRFDHTKRFEGDDLELLISIDYNGAEDPTAFTWINISDRVNWNTDLGSWEMTSSGNINLSDFTGESISIAFKYVGGNSDGSTYQIDNLLLQEFEAPASTPIYDIQFTEVPGENNTYPSPMEGEIVTIYGVVTAVYGSGYFVQDAEGAWNGIQVFNSANTPVLNDQVLVTGEVAEWNGVTQITNVSEFVNEGVAASLFEPVVISTNEISQEMHESVLCQVASATCTNANLGFNEWEINDGSGAGIVDDLMFEYSPTLNEQYRVTGVGFYSFGKYKIEPRFEQDIEKNLNVTVTTKNNDLTVYPNPARKDITLNGWENGTIKVVNVLGSVVLEHEIQNPKTIINVSDLKTGIYFVQQNNNSVKLIIK